MILQEVKYDVSKDVQDLAKRILDQWVISLSGEINTQILETIRYGDEDGFKNLSNFEREYQLRDSSTGWMRSQEVKSYIKGTWDRVELSTAVRAGDGIYYPKRGVIKVGFNQTNAVKLMGLLREKYTDGLSREKIYSMYSYQDEIAPSKILHSFARLMLTGVESVLIHELQHIVDNHRSKGKFDDDPRSNAYYKKYSGSSDFDTERAFQYLNLPHEYWARFSQFIKKINFLDKSDQVKKYSPRDLLKFLQMNFEHWDVLVTPAQRRILKATINYYEALKREHQ